MVVKKLRVLLFETPENPWFNMAFEEALARIVSVGVIEEPCLRIWRNREAIVIGYMRNVEDEVNVELANKWGTPIIRRFTGGGAVYHDLGNINYTIAIKPREKIEKPVDYMYSELLNGILLALRKLGLNPYVENINDIVVNGRKVSGTAATLFWNIAFLHGSLLVNTNLEKLKAVLKIPPKGKYVKKVSPVKYRVENISNLLRRKTSMKEIIENIISGYEELLKAEAYLDKPSSLELRLANLLFKERYVKKTWNTKRRSIWEYRDLEDKIRAFLEENLF
ncbi:MAG: lipoate--protein ligase family protein [Thermoprotei archaeon]|nr:MAG: lipoate--protein ligase family protein [Thermoprotei archaeon]